MSMEKKEKPNMSTTNELVAKSLAGKKPLSTKPKVGPAFDDVDIFGDKYNIGKLKGKLKDLGFEVRFVNKHLLDMVGGYHQRGWKVFKWADFIDAEGTNHLSDALEGRNPDGVIQIAHDILAVRPISMGDRHRADIDKRTKRQAGLHLKNAAESLRESARMRNADVKVLEGYEENE